MKSVVHHYLALLISLAFLAGVFVLPVVSAASLVFSIATGNWRIWHVLPMLHMALVALCLHVVGPAFDRKKISG